ncbi:MAG TPA: SRPBCC family protein [Actinomycetota bacterium]|jgi:hypothetical protein
MALQVVHVDEIDIAVPPERVYAHRLDFFELAKINPNVANIERTDGGTEPGVGAVYKFDTTIEGMGTMPTTLTVTEAEDPGTVSNVMDAGLPARETTTFTPAGDGTHVRFEVTIDLPDGAEGLEDMVRESTAKNVRLELEKMKTLLEST